jgi:phosphohistidine phosphatase
MKTLLIIRHAKSSWDFSTMNDFDRPLNQRGVLDAPKMANKLLAKNINIDCFVSSPAKRALTTAQIFANTFNYKEKSIIQIPALYHAASSVFYKVISEIEDKNSTVAIFSHNPGITDFVNQLTTVRIDNMPTCAVFSISITSKYWKDFKEAEKEFLFFDYPKNL